MTPLLWRSSLRHLLHHPWQIGLAVLGVALGVAVVVSIDLANASARRAFDLSTEAVSGRATHQVVGGPAGLPDEAFVRLRLDAGTEAAAPVVEDWITVPPNGTMGTPAELPGIDKVPATLPRRPGRALHLLGIDPFSERPFRPYLSGAGGEGGAREASRVDLAPFLTRPGAVLLADETARELGLAPGEAFTVLAGGTARQLELSGVLEPADDATRRALADLVVVDIATAQEVLGRPGRLSRIDLLVPEGAEGEALLARARAALPPGARVERAAARSRTSEEMTRAFRLNLTALSLLALVCGVFLIYNTMTFSVVQRRTLIGTLRALGVTRGQVFTAVLGEALALALAGTAVGLPAGVVLGRGMVRLVTRTINDLYFVLTVRELAVPASVLLTGAAVGIGATLLAALAPAVEATAAPPRAVLIRSALEARARRALPRVTAAGVGLLALGAALLAVPGPLLPGFAGLFAVILGCALLAPAGTVALVRLLRPAMGALFGVLGRMAAGGVVASLSRTAVAIAALVIAVSVTVGVGVMIGSFRQTVQRWLAASLQSDLYAAPAGRGTVWGGTGLGQEVAARAAAVPGVAAVHGIRRAEPSSPDGPVRLVAIDLSERAREAFDLAEAVDDDPEAAWRALMDGAAVWITEPLAHRLALGAGDAIELAAADGLHPFPIAGVYYDYASDQGLVLIGRRAYREAFGDDRLNAFSVDLEPGADPDAVARALRSLGTGSGAPALIVQSNRTLREASLAIFDRTFLITEVLRLLAGLVAFVGVVSALMALELERARELAVLRANGLTPGQVWGLVTAQTGVLGLAAGLLSVPVGLALAAIMIFVINRRSFGWTIRMEVAPEILLQAILLALGAALLAGLYPAWRMARTSPAAALREE